MIKRLPAVWVGTFVGVITGAGCGGTQARTAAASQPTPAAFDVSTSDPVAVKLVDEMVAGLGGGQAAWDGVKELTFTVEYMDGATPKATFTHVWDRWNGHHHLATPVPSPDGGTQVQEVDQDLFAAGPPSELAKVARKRLAEDLYFLALLYKLKDPGVRLTIDNPQIVIEGSPLCQPSCTSITVSFDPEVGTDRWYVNINNETKQAQVIEKRAGAGRIGYELADWTDVGGLRLPTRFQNLGLRSEVIVYSAVSVK